MKKRILLLTLVLCLLLAGCGKAPEKTETFSTDEPMPGFDAQNKYLMWAFTSFQEADSFYIGRSQGNAYLHYYDKKSGISGFLCADPSCAHDAKDCTAYIGSFSHAFCYDGKLYWVGVNPQNYLEECLFRSDLSGTNREKVKILNKEDILAVYNPQQYAIHRGKLYMLGRFSYIDGTQAGRRVSLVSTPLDGSDEYTVLYDEAFDSEARSSFRFVGTHAYFSVVGFSSDRLSRVTVTKIDINTGASETVFEEDAIPELLGSFWVTQEGDIFLPGADDNHAYLWKLEGGKRVEVASWEGIPLFPRVTDGVAVMIYIKDGIRWANIVNLSGETIYNGEMFPEEVPGLAEDPSTLGDYGFLVTGGDAEKLILNLSGGGKYAGATVLLDLTDNMKATVLWTSEK